MQALKALVIIMGALIVIMMGVVAYTIVVKFGEVVDGGDTAAVPAGEAVAWPENRKVVIPRGASVKETKVGDGRLIVIVQLPQGPQQLIVFDLESGERIGVIDFEWGGQ